MLAACFTLAMASRGSQLSQSRIYRIMSASVFVTILLNEVLAWVRTQPGTSSLRAILYMDEIFGYFPQPLIRRPRSQC